MAVTCRYNDASFTSMASGVNTKSLGVTTNAGDLIVVSDQQGHVTAVSGAGATWVSILIYGTMYYWLGFNASAGATSITITTWATDYANTAVFAGAQTSSSPAYSAESGPTSVGGGRYGAIVYSSPTVSQNAGDLILVGWEGSGLSNPALANGETPVSIPSGGWGAIDGLLWAVASSATTSQRASGDLAKFASGYLGLLIIPQAAPPAVLPQSRYYSQAVRRSYTYFKDVVFDRTPRGLLVPKVA